MDNLRKTNLMAARNDHMTAHEYQVEAAKTLKSIFGDDLVKTEWDSVRYDPHVANHKSIYAPRHDIAVGPFNSYMDIDIGMDRASVMKKHIFTKKLVSGALHRRGELKVVWNAGSRCYLAIEIEFSGSSKHVMGSIINACTSGAIGLVVANQKNVKRVSNIARHLKRLEGLGQIKINYLRNLIIFDDSEFSELLDTVRRSTEGDRR